MALESIFDFARGRERKSERVSHDEVFVFGLRQLKPILEASVAIKNLTSVFFPASSKTYAAELPNCRSRLFGPLSHP